MCYKNITNILHPNELKLLVCGEPNCSVDQMKKLFNVHVNDSSMDAEKVVQIFWNVIESFSVEERILFIKFSSGNMGLPAPGLKWKNDINVIIKEKNDKDSLAKSYTCFSSVNIPYFESEEQLSKILKASINFSGLIIDNNDNIDELYELL